MRRWFSAKINDIKLRQKLLASFLCLNIITTVFVTAFIASRTGEVMHDQVGKSALIASGQTMENIQNKLIEAVGVSNVYYSDLYFQALLTQNYASDFDSLMMYQNYTRPNMNRNINNILYNRISVYLDNESYLKDGVLFIDEAEIADKDYTRQARAERGRVCWSAPERNEQGQMVFYMTRMLNALDANHPAGLFLMEIPSDRIFSLFAHEAAEKDILVVNGDGFVMAASDHSLCGLPVGETAYAKLAALEDGRIHQTELSDMPVNVILETIPIPNSSKPWRMLSAISMDRMYASIDRTLRQSFWASGAWLLVSAVLIWLLSSGLTKRLTLLSRNIAQVKEQHFDRIVDVSGGDEIGELAGDFNIMAARVDGLINQVYKERLTRMDLLVKQRDAELEALQSRINPHFLFNTLDSIRMHTILDEKEKAARMITALCELFRYSVGKDSDVATLGAELKNVGDFAGIFALRYDGRIGTSIDVPDSLTDRRMPRLILQPIVENAFIHGLKNARGMLRLRIYAERVGGMDRLVIEDDGCGIAPERLARLNESFVAPVGDEREHIGLRNVNDRLRLFGGDACRLSIESEVDVFTRVYVPIAGAGEASG